MNRHCQLIALLCGLGLAQAARADSTLEYLVAETAAKPVKPQPVVIKDGRILVKGAGGDGNLDFIYSSAPERLYIVDHHKRSVMALDEDWVKRLAKQAETVQPLLQGFAAQIGKLNAKQRAKWEEMLGGKISLDAIAQAARPSLPARAVNTGRDRTVAGIACKQINIFEGNKQTAQVCLADAAKLELQEADYLALRSMFSFAERLATKTQGLTQQFGVGIPNLDLKNLAGVPIELRDASKDRRSLILNRITAAKVDAGQMQAPADYRSEEFKLW